MATDSLLRAWKRLADGRAQQRDYLMEHLNRVLDERDWLRAEVEAVRERDELIESMSEDWDTLNLAFTRVRMVRVAAGPQASEEERDA